MGLLVRGEAADRLAVDEHRHVDAGGEVRDRDLASRGTTSGRMWSECGATNVSTIASSPHTSTGPPFERLYAVEPVDVATISPSHGWCPSSSPLIA